jgi:hypothetical protein
LGTSLQEKGTFVRAGEAAQGVADATAEKARAAAGYVAEVASNAKDAVVDTSYAAGEKVAAAAHSAEHSTADGLRWAADKIDPEVKSDAKM